MDINLSSKYLAKSNIFTLSKKRRVEKLGACSEWSM